MQKTSIDWFGFRCKDEPQGVALVLSESLPDHLEASLAPRKTGWRAFERSYDLWISRKGGDPEKEALRVGLVATGGEAVKDWTFTSMSGSGCQWIEDWGKTMDSCTDGLTGFELKRVDIALDRFDGSHWSEVDQAWHDGLFCPPGGGKKPKAKPIDSRRPEDGRTYYVGSRESAKFYRGYEKGMQILGPQIIAAEQKNPGAFDAQAWFETEGIRMVTEQGKKSVQTFNYADWWRDEVEFKPVNQPLPLDIVENRDQYFAGAFPYLAQVLPAVEPQAFVTRRERMPQLELAMALNTIQRQYGNTLFTALHAYHGDMGAVWDQIIGKKHNKALIDAGVLMVEH